MKTLPDWKSRLDFLIDNSPESTKYSRRYQKLIMNAVYYRVKSVLEWEGIQPHSIKSSVTLIRPSEISTKTDEDYGLSKVN